ncbi:hypothetical protein BKA57DRAFT_204358 [Linnemannia elongata]|nr:hypothetical protein BKA57DRAFT_204358 [Linnemannia elongata]
MQVLLMVLSVCLSVTPFPSSSAINGVVALHNVRLHPLSFASSLSVSTFTLVCHPFAPLLGFPLFIHRGPLSLPQQPCVMIITNRYHSDNSMCCVSATPFGCGFWLLWIRSHPNPASMQTTPFPILLSRFRFGFFRSYSSSPILLHAVIAIIPFPLFTHC